MILFYSGNSIKEDTDPELLIDRPTIMLSYIMIIENSFGCDRRWRSAQGEA